MTEQRRVLKKCEMVLTRALELAHREHFDGDDKKFLPPLLAEIRQALAQESAALKGELSE